jgi:hypothetical protein
LKLIDTKKKATIDEAVVQLDAAQIVAELGPRVSAMFEKRGHALAAKLIVELDPPASAISIDGKPAMPGAHLLAAGRHRIEATHPDHLAQSIEVDTVAGTERTVTLSLTEEATLIESPWLWVGIAAVLAGATTALLIGTRSTERYVCAPFEGADCDPR